MQTQGVNEDDILEKWSLIRFMNRIAYLKEKNHVINEMSKKPL